VYFPLYYKKMKIVNIFIIKITANFVIGEGAGPGSGARIHIDLHSIGILDSDPIRIYILG
jgi:hypothetical protein